MNSSAAENVRLLVSPQELGDLAEVRWRAVAIADLLVGGLRAAALRD